MTDQDNVEHDASEDSMTCTDVTGIADCDYVAELDASVDRADRGRTADQLLAQLTTHIAKWHKDHVLSPDDISRLRSRITG